MPLGPRMPSPIYPPHKATDQLWRTLTGEVLPAHRKLGAFATIDTVAVEDSDHRGTRLFAERSAMRVDAGG